MLFIQFIVANLIICSISVIKSDELLGNTLETTTSTTISSSTIQANAAANDPASLALKDNDFKSFTLENFQTTTSNLGETSSILFSNLRDIETTPSWELIYPEQNGTSLQPALSSSTSTLVSNLTTESLKAVLPLYFKVDDVTNCQRFFGQCLRQVLAKVVPKLKGNKLLNVPPLDPLYFNATAFQFNSGPFTGYITIRYALIYGLTNTKFQKIEFLKQADKFKTRLNMLVPKMSIVGSYKGDLHINNVRVRPRGDFNVSMTSLRLDFLSLGVVYKKDDHTFLKFTKGNATTTFKDSKINATGIFPDQRLNDIVVNVANQYWRELFNVVLPETRSNWMHIVLDTLNAAMSMVPFDFFDGPS